MVANCRSLPSHWRGNDEFFEDLDRVADEFWAGGREKAAFFHRLVSVRGPDIIPQQERAKGCAVPLFEAPAEFLTSVSAVEKETGLDFFSELPRDLQNKLEAERASAMWCKRRYRFNVSSATSLYHH